MKAFDYILKVSCSLTMVLMLSQACVSTSKEQSGTPSARGTHPWSVEICGGDSMLLRFDNRLGDDSVITIPDRQAWSAQRGEPKVALSSTTQLPYLQALDALDQVVACPYVSMSRDSLVLARWQRGYIEELMQGDQVDLERLMAVDPHVYLYDPRDRSQLDRIRAAGITCIPFYEYEASDPLKRLNWLGLMGHVLGREQEADSYLSKVKSDYELLRLGAENQNRPKVLFGSFYQGRWAAAGGGSLFASMIRDAGGDYVIQGDETGSVELDMEQLLVLLAQVDMVGMVYYGPLTKSQFTSLDSRLSAELIASKTLFYCNSAEQDYFGKGILEPHYMLADLMAIFQSDQLHSPSYFQRTD